MFNFQQRQSNRKLLYSDLLTQDDFYNTFTNDLLRAKQEVIIESPFITFKRLDHLLPVFRKLICRNVRILINTKSSEEQDADYSWQTKKCFAILLETGVEVFVTGGHHRKIAIIDREILYEGSLNILSQNDSCEIMRRIHSKQLAMQMIDFINSSKFIG
jgi:phosphatidylserine/phosphatidylglycerophosphate/cardiolipin synthase-like enzyme